MLRSVVLVLTVVLAVPAYAQSTREEAIAIEQAKKAKALKPEQAPEAEIIAKRITSAIGRTPEGPYPWFGSIFPGGWFAAGVGYGRSLPRASRINLVSGFSIKAYKLLSAEFLPRAVAMGRLHTSFGVEWIDAPGVAFYGLGPGSANVRSSYGYRPTTAHGSAVYQANGWLSFSGGYNFLHAKTDEGEGIVARFDPAETPGLNQSLNFNVAYAGFKLDTRPSPGYSTHGAMFRTNWSKHSERKDLPYSFSTAEYELGAIVPLVREQFGLMFRGLATMSRPEAGHAVPVMLAPMVGSGSTVRGFRNRRFQDNGRVVLTGEYRWRPSRYLDMALFLDAGQVAPEWKAFRSSAFETAWGIGARLHGPSFTVMRVELARSRNGLNLVVAATPAF